MFIRLVPGDCRTACEQAAGLHSVPIPTGLEDAHPVISSLRDDPERLVMPADLRFRSLLVLQAIASAATERGWDVNESPAVWHAFQSHLQNPPARRAGAIEIGIEGFDYTVTIDQEHPRATDPVKAGFLVVVLPQARSRARSRWADRGTRPLEQQLPDVIGALTQRAAEDRAYAAEQQQDLVDRNVAWEAAIADAEEISPSSAAQGIG
ncbi:hypothetical protein GCM10009853_023100 [Glycomyces scopariae]